MSCSSPTKSPSASAAPAKCSPASTKTSSPDFLCLAKGLTGGYMPLAATLATDEICERLSRPLRRIKNVFPRPHLRRQPAGCCRGAGEFTKFSTKNKRSNRLQPKISRLSEHLARISKHRHVGDVRQHAADCRHRTGRKNRRKNRIPGKNAAVGTSVNRPWKTACLCGHWEMLWSLCRRWQFDSMNSIEFALPWNVGSRKRSSTEKLHAARRQPPAHCADDFVP